MNNLLKKLTPPEPLGQCDSNFIGMFQTVRFIQMMSLTFGLFTQVSNSGPLGPQDCIFEGPLFTVHILDTCPSGRLYRQFTKRDVSESELFTGDTSRDSHSPGPVFREVSLSPHKRSKLSN